MVPRWHGTSGGMCARTTAGTAGQVYPEDPSCIEHAAYPLVCSERGGGMAPRISKAHTSRVKMCVCWYDRPAGSQGLQATCNTKLKPCFRSATSNRVQQTTSKRQNCDAMRDRPHESATGVCLRCPGMDMSVSAVTFS